MARFFGAIGFAEPVTVAPGVTEERIIERTYGGDILQNSRRLVGADTLHDNIQVSNNFSIVADEYIHANIHNLRYVKWYGNRWKITNVMVQRPRLVIYIGGLYNGPEAEDPKNP